MKVYQKIVFHLIRLCRMTWYAVRYTLHPWKQLHCVSLPINVGLGYSVLRFVDSGEYESGEITIVSKTLEKTDIVLELGTGLGFLSAYCSKIIGSERVQTFEANPELRSLIQKTYKKNNVFPELHFAAIGADEGETDFYISKSGFFTSSTLKSKMAKKMIVPVRGINNVLRALKPTYLLMDIEGGELEIFRSIDFCCIQKIQFELHPQFLSEKEVSDIFSILGRNGFNRITDLEQGNNYYFKRC